MRDIVIGDIHGCYDELMSLLKALNFSEETDRIISVGDIVDRGPDSVKVYQFFKENPKHIVVMGNHENKHHNQVLSYSQEIVKVQFGTRYPEFLEWVRKLPYYYETESAIIVHAAIEPDVPLKDQKKEVLMGSTSGEKYLTNKIGSEDWTSLYQVQKPVLFGHRVVGDVAQMYGDKIYGLDTGACFGGFLTAITLPDFQIYSVKADRNYWKSQMETWQVEVVRAKPWKTFEFEKIQKEISKIRNSKQPEIVEFISDVENWFRSLEEAYGKIIENLEYRSSKILEEFGADSFIKASKEYEYNVLLILSQKKRLNVKHLKDSFKTPAKLFQLLHQLDLKVEDPFLKIGKGNEKE
ncbi:metallophosphoesterase [Leptospira kmetyi]|uniref:Calcineurin-like phosphoesterase domain-containing protein n=1 Tax=Leptospira kmetyi TaxID=408139 RepID=A0ABX4NDB1_9LEPT|nr:metallophosphoesterase [Leptospira kmetyi]PJZ31353.1 hypothetical protein CH378_02380 [Leptospira kmetyi]TGL66166.1 serine/threonine protein phosphatase [Leptospira kmetyi]